MDNKLGIKETKEVVDGVLSIYALGKDVFADGKINAADFSHVLAHAPAIAMAAHGAIDGADKVIPELKDLDGEELAELVSHTMSKLSIDNAKAILIVEKSLKVAIGIIELVKAISMPNEIVPQPEAPAEA